MDTPPRQRRSRTLVVIGALIGIILFSAGVASVLVGWSPDSHGLPADVAALSDAS